MLTLEEKFEIYDSQNPHVYDLFVQFARKTINAGYKKYSANAIFERIRWHLNIEKPLGDEYKMNNNYRAFYARKMMSEYPSYNGFFETREQKSKKGTANDQTR